MYDFEQIKLVIWDLDDTLWKGILSEGPVTPIPENLTLVHQLTDAGIVNSICSKNDPLQAESELEKLRIREEFVFLSVNWEPKGQRIRRLITNMQLRPANVLFIDDNPSNLEEALFYCSGLMTALPSELDALYARAEACQKSDPDHNRLRQYQVLESRQNAAEEYSSNEAFLYSSDIRVVFGDDCQENIDRLHDLVMRSNQLNFTKVRSSEEELTALFQDETVLCGYVSVSDRFGDYGITGFYAVKDRRLIHFCFSCRTLGMGIEQYVYGKLGRPELTIVGEVTASLDTQQIPGWINQQQEHTDGAVRLSVRSGAHHSVLIKGPCDLFQVMPYIADKNVVDTDFTYANRNGVIIESTGHTTHIVEAMRLSPERKELLLSEVPFADAGVYDDGIYTGGYHLVVISILTDANLGVYRRKGTGERLAFLEGYHPITDPANWKSYIRGEYNCANFAFTEENLKAFSEQYEFVGINTPEDIVENLRYIRAHLPSECMLAVMLGGELYYEKNEFPAYENRHIVHKEINDALRAAAPEMGIRLIDVNRYLVDQSSFYDHFNHYIKPVYYALAGEIVDLINEQTGTQLKETTKLKMLQVRLKEMLAPIYYKLKGR